MRKALPSFRSVLGQDNQSNSCVWLTLTSDLPALQWAKQNSHSHLSHQPLKGPECHLDSHKTSHFSFNPVLLIRPEKGAWYGWSTQKEQMSNKVFLAKYAHSMLHHSTLLSFSSSAVCLPTSPPLLESHFSTTFNGQKHLPWSLTCSTWKLKSQSSLFVSFSPTFPLPPHLSFKHTLKTKVEAAGQRGRTGETVQHCTASASVYTLATACGIH